MSRWLLNLLVGIVINGLAISITAALLPGIHIHASSSSDRIVTFLVLGIVFGLVNSLIKPIVSFLSLPFTILTLGLFQLVINALLLLLVTKIVPNFVIDSFWWALLGGIIMGIVGAVLEWISRRLFPKPERTTQRRPQQSR
jgi:putative membrane protein